MQPTGCESNGVKVPCRQLLGIGRLAYPTCEEATTHTVLGSKRHGCHATKSVTSVGPGWQAKLEARTLRNDCSPESRFRAEVVARVYAKCRPVLPLGKTAAQ